MEDHELLMLLFYKKNELDELTGDQLKNYVILLKES